jgi:hypothetical protein
VAQFEFDVPTILLDLSQEYRLELCGSATGGWCVAELRGGKNRCQVPGVRCQIFSAEVAGLPSGFATKNEGASGDVDENKGPLFSCFDCRR